MNEGGYDGGREGTAWSCIVLQYFYTLESIITRSSNCKKISLEENETVRNWIKFCLILHSRSCFGSLKLMGYLDHSVFALAFCMCV